MAAVYFSLTGLVRSVVTRIQLRFNRPYGSRITLTIYTERSFMILLTVDPLMTDLCYGGGVIISLLDTSCPGHSSTRLTTV